MFHLMNWPMNYYELPGYLFCLFSTFFFIAERPSISVQGSNDFTKRRTWYSGTVQCSKRALNVSERHEHDFAQKMLTMILDFRTYSICSLSTQAICLTMDYQPS